MPTMNDTDIPFPPIEYMRLISGLMTAESPQLREMFLKSGNLQTSRFEELGLLNRDLHLLDVGCGCGRFARALLGRPIGSYTGFDRHPGMIEWTQKNIASRDGRFRFLHVNVASPYDDIDGIVGAERAESFVFPFVSNSFTAANLASVFTHMHLPEIDGYARELARVVQPRGTMIFSAFVTQQQPYVRDKFNIHLRPTDLRQTIEAAGWSFIDRDKHRFEREELKFDNNQQNFFVATRQG